MKRLLGLLLAGFFMFSQLGVVWGAQEGQQVREGEGQLNMEQALNIARKVLELPAELKSFDVNYQSSNEWIDSPRWDFNWFDRQQASFRHYSASIDAETGEVINFRSGEGFPESQQRPPGKLLSKEVSRQKAEAFVKKMVGAKFNELKAMPEFNEPFLKGPYGGPRIYQFRWQRLVNGIPFEDEVAAGVDAYTGKVVNYSFRWTRNINFPKVENIKSVEDARKIFQDSIGLRLYYQRKETPFPGWLQPVRLMYLPGGMEQGGLAIDAVTGKLIHRWNGQEFDKGKLEVKPLSIEGIQEAVYGGKKEQKPLSMEEALAVAEKTFSIPNELKLRDRRYNESWQRKGTRIWGFTWGAPDYRSGTQVSVEVDIDSGEVRSYNKFGPSTAESGQGGAQISKDEARKIAGGFLKKLFPGKVSSLAGTQEIFSPEEEKNAPYSFNYVRLVNGIPYNGNNINIQVNRRTGEIENLWMMWDERELPASKEAIPAEKALEKFWASEKLELRYLSQQTKGGSPREVRLAYVLAQDVPKGINALTGEAESIYGFPWKQGVYKDLAGHWVNEKVIALAGIGVVDSEGEEFAPDRVITRAEFVKLLVNASQLKPVNPENPSFADVPKDKWYYRYVETAVREGLVKGDGKQFRPEARVTRQEMAVMLNRLIPADKKAEDGPKLESFKDSKAIAPWAKESARRLVGFGIMKGSDGKFAPGSPASRAEAVSLIYFFLQAQDEPGFRATGAGFATGGGGASVKLVVGESVLKVPKKIVIKPVVKVPKI